MNLLPSISSFFFFCTHLWKSERFPKHQVLMIILWAGSLSSIGFFVLKKTGLLRISEEVEEAGMDSHHHSPPKAYALGSESLSPSKTNGSNGNNGFGISQAPV